MSVLKNYFYLQDLYICILVSGTKNNMLVMIIFRLEMMEIL